MNVLFVIIFLFYILHFYAVPMLLLNSYKMQTKKLLKQ